MGRNLPQVICSHALPEAWLASLKNRCEIIMGPDSVELPGFSPALRKHLDGIEGILSLLSVRIDEPFLAEAPSLRVVSNMAVGVDNIDLAACGRRGIPVGNTPGVVTDATAELCIGLMFAVARRIPETAAAAKAGNWTAWSPTGWLGTDLLGATLGIVGLGSIGRAVASRAAALGMKVVYTSRTRKPDAEAAMALEYMAFEDVLRASDFVALTVALTPETEQLINARALSLLKPSAYLINVARGSVVDTAALADALRNGLLAGAALDVTEPEPLPPTHELFSFPNCVITPHIGTASYRTRKQMAEIACENLLAGLEGRALPHCANARFLPGEIP